MNGLLKRFRVFCPRCGWSVERLAEDWNDPELRARLDKVCHHCVQRGVDAVEM